MNKSKKIRDYQKQYKENMTEEQKKNERLSKRIS